MKVLLLQDVRAVGRKHDIKDVSDGYAVNFLIPNALAVFATSEAIARATKDQTLNAEKHRLESESLRAGVKELAGKSIVIKSKASEQGHLFRGLNASEIALALGEQTGFHIGSQAILLERPVKEIGEHEISVEADGVQGTFTLRVEKL